MMYNNLQESNYDSIISFLNSLLKDNSTQLTSINNDIPTNIEKIISFLKENEKDSNISSLKTQIEEYKKLQISKDNEISKLNDLNSSKQNEIERFKKIIEDQKSGTREQQIEEEKKKEKEKLNKFGKKALRKIFKKLTSTFNKNDINLMIWEVDTNLDGYIDYNEYENMYKRCVIDEKEREPKKLYHLIQFLMFDKEKKGYITEEDTLEVLCIRNTNGLDNAINDIFGIETNENGKKIIKKRETLNYVEFADIMHKLNLKKRMQLMNKKKIFCDKIKAEAIQNAKNNNLQNQ